MRFLFRPPEQAAAELLTLPWTQPLEEWVDPRLVDVPQRGISRHVVRFASVSGVVWAFKEIPERLARKEYGVLRALNSQGLPAVQVLGVVVDRAELDAILVTRFLPYSTSYRALFSTPRGVRMTERLLDSLVVLLARLHLAGVFWGDCSLSNTLFRMDAGLLAAYLVDAETSEQHAQISDRIRGRDLELAHERMGGELMDLAAGGLLPPRVDPIAVADDLVVRYDRLWEELTREEVLPPDEQRYRIGARVRRLNELGFDVEEIELVETGEGSRLKVAIQVAGPGHARHELSGLTGLDVQENQASRLLNDIQSYRAWQERVSGEPVGMHVAALHWLQDVYQPVVRAIPASLGGRLEPAEVFHEVLEHRWYLSEAAARDVGTSQAARSYFAKVLPEVPVGFAAPPPRPA